MKKLNVFIILFKICLLRFCIILLSYTFCPPLSEDSITPIFFKCCQFILLTTWKRQCLKKFIFVLLFHYFDLKYGLWFIVIFSEGVLSKFFFPLPGNKTYLFWCVTSFLQYQLLRIFLEITLVIFQSYLLSLHSSFFVMKYCEKNYLKFYPVYRK